MRQRIMRQDLPLVITNGSYASFLRRIHTDTSDIYINTGLVACSTKKEKRPV